MSVAAIVLAGGRAERLGVGAKPLLQVGGRSLLDRLLDAIGDRRVVLVGPDELRPSNRDEISMVREEPPYAGPLAGIGAGFGALDAGVTTVLILAADMPFLDHPTIERLIDAVHEHPAAVLSSGGRHHWLTAAWQRNELERALLAQHTLENGRVRPIYDGLDVAVVECDERTGFDIDTIEDLERAEEWQ